MFRSWFRMWLRRQCQTRPIRVRNAAGRQPLLRLRAEALEDRTLPTTVADPGLALVPRSLLFVDSFLTSPGLVGSYVNANLRNASNSLSDWRQTQVIAGTRTDPTVGFFQHAWGSRASVGVTGGTSDSNWENFSVQWDGFVQIPADGTYLSTASDDGSRMWIDVNGDGSFANSATELVSNNWGNSHATGTIAGPPSVSLTAGTYRIRLQYEEGGGGNQMFLLMGNRPEVAGLTPVPTTLLSLDPARTNPGLEGTYINRSLRGYAPQDDWRQTQVVAGKRTDPSINFPGDGFGARAAVGITGGTDTNWENFSVQWDGFVTIPEDGIRLYTRSDDGSRMWIDVNGDSQFGSTTPEFVNNNWGGGQGVTTGPASDALSKGTYRIRVQYEEGGLTNSMFLAMAAPTPTNVRAAVTGTQAVPVVNPSFESQVLGDGGFIDGTVSGWTLDGPFAGPQNWVDADFAGAADADFVLGSVPDGRNSAFSRGSALSQVLNTTLAANTQYVLYVDVGHRANGAFRGYRVQLLAGGVVLGEDNNSHAPDFGQFLTSTVTFTTGGSHPQLGQPLQIRLVGLNSTDPNGFVQVIFDNVRLSQSPAGVVDGNRPSITASWDRVITAGNYLLERATSPGGPYKQIAIFPAGVQSYADQGTHLGPQTSYYYRVRSVAGGVSSDESQVASVTTHRPYRFYDFDGGASPEWSRQTTSVTPVGGRRFLGPFAGETVSLALSDLPAHTEVAVSFDLLVIQSWDGSSPFFWPDIWDLRVRGGETLVHTTFSNAFASESDFPQSYPGTYPADSNPGLTGAVERGTLGYPKIAVYAGVNDSVYRITKSFLHTGNALTLDFIRSTLGIDGLHEESWGLDNVSISLNQPPTISITGPTPAPEGDAGTRDAVFTVTLSAPSKQPVRVDFQTFDGTARAGEDYLANSGTLVFEPGAALTQALTVRVNGDRQVEGDETLAVRLSGAINATIDKAEGIARILADDQGIDRWWATAGEGTPMDVLWIANVPNSNSYFLRITALATGEVLPPQWSLAEGAALSLDGGPPLTFSQQVGLGFRRYVAHVPGVLAPGLHQFLVSSFDVPDAAVVEQVRFELVPEVFGTHSPNLTALFVADHSEVQGTFPVAGESAELTAAELVRHFAPILHFDASERYAMPFAVDLSLAADGLRRGGRPLAPGSADDYLDLSLLATGRWPRPGASPAIYATVLQDPGRDELAVNYYFHYPRSNWAEFGGRNTHEGDWEGVTLFLKRSGVFWYPDRLALAQHVEVLHTSTGGERSRWDDLRRVGSRPEVFVGLGGHATYPLPGITWLAGFREDHPESVVPFDPRPDPSPVVYLPRVAHSGAPEWLRYPGYWGRQNLDGSITPNGDSGPRGPVFQDPTLFSFGSFAGQRWLDPWSWSDRFPWVTHTDPDGVGDSVEDRVAVRDDNGDIVFGDGNRDGVADRSQQNVASLPNASDEGYVTIVSSAGTVLSNVYAVPAPPAGMLPPGVTLPVGSFHFDLLGPSGGGATVTFLLPTGVRVSTFYRYGPTPGDPTDRWYEFLFDGVTGAVINGNRITVHYVDGQRGDDDLTANGVIRDPGAPALDPSTTTTLTASGPSTYGQVVTFTATVRGHGPYAGVPTGWVQFRVDGSDAGSPVPLTNGTASVSVATLGAGSHEVTAVYTSDSASFAGGLTPVPLVQTVARAVLTVTADDRTKVYGENVPPLTARYTGFVLGEGSGVLGGALSLTTPAGPGSDVGAYPITPAGHSSSNYAITYVGGTLTVTKKDLVITADDYTRPYGRDNPAFTARYAGFVLGQDPSVLGGALAFHTPAVPASAPGTYAITPGGLTSGNYAITFAVGVLTVVPATLSATGRTVTATAGAPFGGVVATFANADPFGSAASYAALISWGDGTTSAGTIIPDGNGGFAVSGSHTYAAAGSYAVSVRVSHVLGHTTTGMATGSAAVTDLGQAIEGGQTAGIGFWHNRNGQALIRSFNGGPTATALADWLAASFPNLYGAGAGAHNLTGRTNAEVAAFFLSLFNLRGPKLDAQVLATALNVYATTLALGGSAGQAYGFRVSVTGLGARSYNVGSSGAAFGVANGTTLNVYQLLRAADSRAVGGVLYGGDSLLRKLAIDVFDGVNEA